ncbi:MAG: hypothetical protein SGJ27_26595 [Candidatus Melainabacteria bacterium]|nr:hypothetical protein [Candidatus Melainabacteria bacterium]
MNWRRFLPTTKQITDVATSKAAQAAAGAVVERFGPHRFLSKVGAVMIIVGLIVLPLSWYFLTGWIFWVATVGGAGLIGFGYALRGFNSLVISLLARFLKYVWRRLYDFGKGRVESFKARRAARTLEKEKVAEVSGNCTQSKETTDGVQSKVTSNSAQFNETANGDQTEAANRSPSP